MSEKEREGEVKELAIDEALEKFHEELEALRKRPLLNGQYVNGQDQGEH